MDNVQLTSVEEEDVPSLVLRSWGFPEFVNIFRDNDIDVELFLEMDLEMLNSLSPPNTSLGTKFKLLKNIKSLKAVQVVQPPGNGPQDAGSCLGQLSAETAGCSVNGQQSAVASSSQHNVDSSPAHHSSGEEYNPHQSDLSEESDSPNIKRRKKNASSGPTRTKKKVNRTRSPDRQVPQCSRHTSIDSSDDENLAATQKRLTSNTPTAKPAVNPNNLAEKRVAATTTRKQLCDLDLETLLNQSLEGKAILHCYECNKFLEEDDKNSLADSLVKWFLMKSVKPSKEDFCLMRDKILQLFPNETNVYYIPPCEEGEQQTMARGKLFDRCRNVKEWMRKKGLLERVKGVKRNKERIAYKEKSGQNATPEIEEALKWLKSFREPFETVILKWSLTSKHRMNELLASRNSTKKLGDYLNANKVLRQKDGFVLVSIDFKTLHEDKVEALATKWDSFKNNLMQMLQDKPALVKDPEGKAILQRLNKCNDEDAESLLLLLLLPSLLPPSRMVKFGNRKIKPSVKESRESFLSRVNNSSQLQDFIGGKGKDVAAQYGSKATVQPYVLYVGAEGKEEDVTDFYVVVDDHSYHLSTALQAVDICFKSFFAFDVGYPPPAEQIWLFLQKHIYNISTADDANILNVKTFMQRINLQEK